LKIKRGKKQPGINFRYPPRHISPLGLGSVDRMRGPAKKNTKYKHAGGARGSDMHEKARRLGKLRGRLYIFLLLVSTRREQGRRGAGSHTRPHGARLRPSVALAGGRVGR